MNISLVFPRMKYKTGDPPYGMALLAAQLRKHDYSVDLVDSTFHPTIEYIKERIKDYNPDVVGIYCDSLMLADVKIITKFSKDLGKIVFIGGPQATLQPESLVDFADYVVKGEAEIIVLEILEGKHKDAKIVEGTRADLDELPFAAYDLLEMEEYFKLWHMFDSVGRDIRGTNVLSSRGCPYRCTFCQPVLDKMFGKGVRTRSVENVISEIKSLKDKYNINAVAFNDDTFTARKGWIIEFCRRLKEEHLNIYWGINARVNHFEEKQMRMMYDAGLRVIHTGVETGSQRVADQIYHKDIDLSKVPGAIKMAESIGIRCLCYFMLGAPGETKEEIEQTIRFARSLDATEITATISTPLPQTYMYEAIKDKYSINQDYDYYKNRVFENPDVSFSELKFLQKRMLFAFYSHPKRWKYIARHITSMTGIKKMLLKISRFI